MGRRGSAPTGGRRREAGHAQRRWPTDRTRAILAGAVAVAIGVAGLVTYALVTGGDQSDSTGVEATDDPSPPTSEGMVADALIQGENFPGFVEVPVTAPIGQGPGLCGGQGEAEIRTPVEIAATTVMQREDMVFVYQALFVYGSEDDADAVIDQIREDGSSCRAYDVEPEQGQTVRYEVDPANVVLPQGWNEIASFSGRVGTEEAPSSELSLSFVRLGGVMMVMSISAPTADEAGTMLGRILPRAAQRVSETLT